MLSEFTAPPTVTCFLCKAWISVKKGDKTRFLHHISSDHEVHFDLDLVFVLSTMAVGEREAIVNNNLEAGNKKEAVSEKGKEPGNIDIVQEQSRPKRLRVEIKRINMTEVPHGIEDPESSPKSKRMKRSILRSHRLQKTEEREEKTQQRMKRTNRRSQIATNHKKRRQSRKKAEEKALKTRKDLVELVDVMTKDLESLVDCMFCDEKLATKDQRAHMKNVHKTDVDPKTLKQEVVGLENSKDLKILPPPPVIKKEEVPPTQKVKCEICGKKVAASKMKPHLSRLHPDQSVKCCLCYETLARKDKLRQHISLVHPQETEFINTRLEPTFTIEECRVACANCEARFITTSSRDHHAIVNHKFSQYSPITLT